MCWYRIRFPFAILLIDKDKTTLIVLYLMYIQREE